MLYGRFLVLLCRYRKDGNNLKGRNLMLLDLWVTEVILVGSGIRGEFRGSEIKDFCERLGER